jgi:hypothetical protein
LLTVFAFMLMLHQPMLRIMGEKVQQALVPVRLVAATYLPIANSTASHSKPQLRKTLTKKASERKKQDELVETSSSAITSPIQTSELSSLASMGPANDNDFSLQYDGDEEKPDGSVTRVFPYVPSSSFVYRETPDTVVTHGVNGKAVAAPKSIAVKIDHLKEALRINSQVLNKLQSTVQFNVSLSELKNAQLEIQKAAELQVKLKDELETVAVAKALKDEQLRLQRAQRELQRQQLRAEERVRKAEEEQKLLGKLKKIVEI